MPDASTSNTFWCDCVHSNIASLLVVFGIWDNRWPCCEWIEKHRLRSWETAYSVNRCGSWNIASVHFGPGQNSNQRTWFRNRHCECGALFLQMSQIRSEVVLWPYSYLQDLDRTVSWSTFYGHKQGVASIL